MDVYASTMFITCCSIGDSSDANQEKEKLNEENKDNEDQTTSGGPVRSCATTVDFVSFFNCSYYC